MPSGAADRPWPRRSGVMTRYIEPSVDSCDAHIEWSNGNPWSKTTTGPGPLSLLARSIGMAPTRGFSGRIVGRAGLYARPQARSIDRARALPFRDGARPIEQGLPGNFHASPDSHGRA